MTLLETINYFIDEQQAELSDLEWQIHEQTNYDDEKQEIMDWLCEDYDEVELRLKNLIEIKSILQND